jgi:hypothetical protein
LQGDGSVLTGPNVILSLQIAVVAVTLLLLASLIALAAGKQRLHGQINRVFFVLTLIAVLGLELVIRLVSPEVRDYVHRSEESRAALNVHLWFSVPSALLLPLMMYSGQTHRRRLHLTCAFFFAILWTGTFVTGLFYLN